MASLAQIYITQGNGQWIPSGVWQALQFQAALTDPDGCYSALQPTRLTVPAAWAGGKIRLTGQSWYDTTIAYTGEAKVQRYNDFRDARGIRIDKNGTRDYHGAGNSDYVHSKCSGTESNSRQVQTMILDAVEGDYYELLVCQLTNLHVAFKADPNNLARCCWFQMELL